MIRIHFFIFLILVAYASQQLYSQTCGNRQLDPGIAGFLKVSPILTEDLSGLPAVVIINAEFDPLRDDGALYARRLRNAGVKVWEKCFAGQIQCRIGTLPGDAAPMEYERVIKEAMQHVFNK